MDVRKVVNRRIRHSRDGVDVVGDINAVIAANVNEPGGSSHVSSKQRIVQRNGETVVSEHTTEGGPRGRQGRDD
jgi:hypothetical protein